MLFFMGDVMEYVKVCEICGKEFIAALCRRFIIRRNKWCGVCLSRAEYLKMNSKN